VRPSERKNQKNIYIHKINSLIKISRENLLEDEREISNALKKYVSPDLGRRSPRCTPNVVALPF
jgi:hypothetical protein